MCFKRAKLEQKLKHEKKTKGKKMRRTSTSNCQTLSSPSSKAQPVPVVDHEIACNWE